MICSVFSVFFKSSFESFLCERRQNRLLEGFRDTLYIIAGSVAAGRQMPLAIEDAWKQCKTIYGQNSDICKELETICNVYNQSHGELEVLLQDFGRRSGLAEIIQFASSYEICRKNGGDVENVCMKSANILLDKIEFGKEAKAMISEKKMDIILLTAMPLGMVLILNVTSFSYISPLYGNTEGRIIMSLCLAGIALALKSGIKITNIKV